jgi:hypothetical protein
MRRPLSFIKHGGRGWGRRLNASSPISLLQQLEEREIEVKY